MLRQGSLGRIAADAGSTDTGTAINDAAVSINPRVCQGTRLHASTVRAFGGAEPMGENLASG